MGKVVKAVAIIGLGVATGGVGFAGVGSFLTTTFVGKLLTTVAFSALSAALTRQSGSASQQQPGIRTSQTQTGGTNPASFVIGRYASEGTLACPTMSHGSVGGVPNAYLTYVIELGDVPGQTLEGIFVDGEEVSLGTTPHADYGTPFEGRFAGYGWVKFHDGTQTTADPMLLSKYGNDANRPWTSAMVGAGLNYAIVTTRYNRNIFTSFPKVRFVVGGIPLYDPRKDDTVGGVGSHRYADRTTWEQSQNPAVQIYNIKRGIDLGGGYVWGGGSDAEDLPLSNWWAAMNNADTPVALDAGGTEPQYRASYEIFVDDEPAKVIEEILNACSGELAENGGVWKLRLGGPGLPVLFLSDEDLVVTETEEYSPFRAEQEPYNGVSVVYPDPDALWEPRDAPARYNAEYALADPAQRRVADLTLSAAPYPNQVQRIMRAYVHEELRIIRHVLTLPPEALVLETLDVVSWTSDRHGYTGKAFEIDAHIDPLMTGTPRVTLKERDPEDVAWFPEYELPTPNVPTSVSALPPQTVDGFAVAAVAIEDENGTPARPAIQLAWSGNQEDVRGLEYEIEAADGTSIVRGSVLNVASGVHVVAEGILPDKSYRVRARFIVFRPTVWTDYLPVTTLDLRLRPEDLDTPSFQTTGLALFGGTIQSDNFVPDVSGWQIKQDGAMELQNLVARDWIKVGAVSEGVEFLQPEAQSYLSTTDEEIVWSAPLGPMLSSQFWHLSFIADLRGGGRRYISASGLFITSDYHDTNVRLQYRGLTSGVWGDWITIGTFENIRSYVFQTYRDVYHMNGEFEQAEVCLRASVSRLRLREYEPDQNFNYPLTNLRNIAISAKTVVV